MHRANDVARLGHGRMNICVDRLVGIHSLSRFSLGRANSVRGVSRRRRRQMMLEQHVVLVGNTADTPEDLVPVNKHIFRGEQVALTSHFINSFTYDPNPSMIWPCQQPPPSTNTDTTYVVIVPDVDLRNLAIGHGEHLRAIPRTRVSQRTSQLPATRPTTRDSS